MCESASSTDPAEMAVSSFGKKSDRSSRLGTRKEGVGGGVTTNDEGATLLDSDDRICATEADALGIEPVISRCAGGDEDATVACLDSLVYAACAAVERAPSAVVASETAPETAESGREPTVDSGCYDDGAVRLVGAAPRDPCVGGVRQGVQDPIRGLSRRGFESVGRRRGCAVSGDARASRGDRGAMRGRGAVQSRGGAVVRRRARG